MTPVAGVSGAIMATTNHIQAEAHDSGIHDGCCSEVGSAETIPCGFREEDNAGIKGERVGGNRWLSQEKFALLKLRSDLNADFRDACLKYPLWEEVSRKMAELGFQRSAKKCQEKFQNVMKEVSGKMAEFGFQRSAKKCKEKYHNVMEEVSRKMTELHYRRIAKKHREKFQNFYNYRKRTRDGRISKSYGRTYRFFNQLDALREDDDLLCLDYAFKRRLNDDFGTRSKQNDFPSNFLQDTQALPGSSVQWKNMQLDPSLPNLMQPNNFIYLGLFYIFPRRTVYSFVQRG